MTIKPHLDMAGAYPVVQIACPHFVTPANLAVPRTGVLHTTEGGWDGSMSVFHAHYAPQFIVGYNAHYVASTRLGLTMPKPPSGAVEIAQLVPVGVIGAACKAHNDGALVQVEMVGFSKETPWLPDAATLDGLASLMLACRDAYGIPLSHSWKDGDYGKAGDNPHRHAGKFGKVAGWYGHGDMPTPDSHWDPGALEWSKVLGYAEVLAKAAAPTKALVS